MNESCPKCQGFLYKATEFESLFCFNCKEWWACLCQNPECSYCKIKKESLKIEKKEECKAALHE